MDKIIEKSNEISAFIGLLVIELYQYEHQFCIEGGYMDSDVKEDVRNICKTLRLIQTALKNPLQYNEEIKSIINKYFTDKNYSGQEEESKKENTHHPTGYAFVIRAMCKKVSKNCNVSLFEDLNVFFEKMGKYLNEQYFWRYD